MDRLWCAGLALSLLVFAGGCQSSSSDEYRELTELPPEPPRTQVAAGPAAESPVSVPMAAETASSTPLESSQPQPEAPAVVDAAPAAAEDRAPDVQLAANVTEAPSADQPPVDVPTGAASAVKPGEIELLIPEKTFQPEGKERALRVSFDDIDLLKVLNMEPVPLDAVRYFPSWLSGLDGETIRLRGWMFPPLEQEGLTGFLFVRDNQICCFGRNPKVYDKLIVNLREGETTKYIQGRPFDVIGTFSIQPEESDGELMILYFIDDAVVIDK